MTYSLSIIDPVETALDEIIGEIEKAVENVRKYPPDCLMYQIDVDIDELLAEHKAIGIVWDIQHVKEQRPDLTDEQAWEVLKECERCWDRSNDPMLDTIRKEAE